MFQPSDFGQLALMGGLSILANNDGRMSTGQLIGRGGLDALAGLQFRKQYEAAMQDKAEQDARAAEEWRWKQDDRQRRQELERRFAAGDDEAFRILYPEQYYMGQRQKAAHEHALKVLQLERMKMGRPAEPVPAISPKVLPAISPKSSPSFTPGASPNPQGGASMGNPSSAMPPMMSKEPAPGLPGVPSGIPAEVFPGAPEAFKGGVKIPTLPPELRKKLDLFRRGLPSHAPTIENPDINPETGEANPAREFPRNPRPVPARPRVYSGEEGEAAGAGPSLQSGEVYDFEGNEMQVNGAVKWGKQSEILLPDGRRVIGQLDPTGNYFRYFGEVGQGAGKQLSTKTLGDISENLAMLSRIRGAGEAARSNPSATGPIKGFINDKLPDALLQWFDPDGTVSRAKIAELSSAVIHDRSGAAVTAAEFPRLRPFIPQIGDTPETVQAKLKQFYAIVQEETNLYLESLESSGYDVPAMLFERNAGSFSAKDNERKLKDIWGE